MSCPINHYQTVSVEEHNYRFEAPSFKECVICYTLRTSRLYNFLCACARVIYIFRKNDLHVYIQIDENHSLFALENQLCISRNCSLHSKTKREAPIITSSKVQAWLPFGSEEVELLLRQVYCSARMLIHLIVSGVKWETE